MVVDCTLPEKIFSIVICSKNPRADAFNRVLEAVRNQSLDADQWELVLVDSNSSPPLEIRSLNVPTRTRIVRVEEPGVFRARMAGVFAATGKWIVFVDDDNVLDHDYLDQAAAVIQRMPEIGLFCGRISGEFERPPPQWLKLFYRQLAIIDLATDSWARVWDQTRVPCWTAGMCIRRHIADSHFRKSSADPFLLSINRVEDVHMVMCVVRDGNLAGLFTCLHMRHLIPKERMTVSYLKRISGETAYNMTRLRCREFGVTVRDFLRPVKNALMAFRWGASPRGRIAAYTALAELRGVIDTCLTPLSRVATKLSRQERAS